MNIPDLVTMIGNLSQSLDPIQQLLSGAAYLFGIVFFMIAIGKLHKIGDHRANSSSHERMIVPIAYMLAGAAMIFLPSAISTLSNTAFGDGNVLQYSEYNRFDIRWTMALVIKTVGLLWCIRGCMLLAHASEPGVQEGLKGLAFLCAGIFAMNFESTVEFLSWMMSKLAALSLVIKTKS